MEKSPCLFQTTMEPHIAHMSYSLILKGGNIEEYIGDYYREGGD